MLNRNKNMTNMNQNNFFAISWSRKLINLMCLYVWAYNFYTQLGREMQCAVLTTLSGLESKAIRRRKATQLHRTSQFTEAFNFEKKKERKLNEKDFGGLYVMYHTVLHLYLLAISVFKGYLKRISQAQTNVQTSWSEKHGWECQYVPKNHKDLSICPALLTSSFPWKPRDQRKSLFPTAIKPHYPWLKERWTIGWQEKVDFSQKESFHYICYSVP